MNWFNRWRVATVLGIFAGVYIALSVFSYTRTSVTCDEPINLLSGYAMLQHHDYRFSPDHVPFTRMWAAIPLVFMKGVAFDPSVMQDTDSQFWLRSKQFLLAEDFMYKWNDADRLLYAARFMMTLLGVGLGILVFCWARELFGFGPAIVALGLFTLEPNTLANAPLITADTGLACFIFGAAYFLWRTARSLSVGNVAGVGVFTALALVSKFWGVLLLPLIPLCLLPCLLGRTPWACRVGHARALASAREKLAALAAVCLVVLGVGYAGVWAAYDFRYLPASAPDGQSQFHVDRIGYVQKNVPDLARRVNWVDDRHLLPNAYLQGFLYGSATVQGRNAYLAGEFRKQGWWYYFLVAFLLKTPIVLLFLLLLGGVLGLANWREGWRNKLPLLLPPLAFFVVASGSNINIGLRYVLLVYPFVLLVATRPVVEFMRRGWRWFAPLVVLIAGGELAWAYPHCLAFFNATVGGPSQGYLYLADSNLDWGQDLKGLKPWMDQHKVERLNLCYFGSADPGYYHINCTQLPGNGILDDTVKPEFPGYLAISATSLLGVYNTSGREFYRPLLERKPVAVIGHSIHIFWIDAKWW